MIFAKPRYGSLAWWIRRNLRRKTRRAALWIVFIVAIGVLGYGLVSGILAYGRTLDEGINRAIDHEYKKVGIAPTRDERERVEVERKRDQYRKLAEWESDRSRRQVEE